jgi:hypothetical protein
VAAAAYNYMFAVLITDVDGRGYEIRWEAELFGAVSFTGGWTPARQRLSEERRAAVGRTGKAAQ